MVGLSELQPNQSELKASLDAGLDVISQFQTITFTQYARVVLPLDGFVFWVRSDLLSNSALLNAVGFNTLPLNAGNTVIAGAPTLVVKGSLHYATTNRQDEDEGYALNQVVFTAQEEVNDLNEVSPTLMYIGDFDGIRFAFSRRQSFYKQAGLYHYVGDAIYPTMDTQIIDNPAQLDGRDLVVSNSLPAWLTLNAIMPVYPSYLVPDNISPPYASIHIAPESTEAIQAVPRLDANSTHWQLASDRVRVTIYGLRNNSAMDYLDYVLAFMTNRDDIMGLMSMPIVRDDKRTQTELGILAQKKTLEFKVSYYQSAMRNVARQLILSCIPSFTISATPVL